jgi:hypothetical protein
VTRTRATAAARPVDTSVLPRADERRQDDVFRSELAAGASIEAAARAAGLDPRRIPVRLARVAPAILAGIPHKQLVEWEREDRIPTGTAAIVPMTRRAASTASRPSNPSRLSHVLSDSQLSLDLDIDGPAR